MIQKTLAILVLLGVNAVAAQAATSIAYTPPSCLPTQGPAVIRATLADANAQAARLYFRAENGTADYYLDMVKAGNDVWAVLPTAAADSQAVVHRIVVTRADGVDVSTEATRSPVYAACQASSLSAEETHFSQNLVIGLTQAAQAETPSGFDCSGITSHITADGVMKPQVPCAQQYAKVQSKNGRTKLVKVLRNPVVLGVLGAAVSGAVVSRGNPGPETPVSTARP